MTAARVVEALPSPALLLDRSLAPVARSAAWTARYGDGPDALGAAPFDDRGAETARAVLETGEPATDAGRLALTAVGDADAAAAGVLVVETAPPPEADRARAVLGSLALLRSTALSESQAGHLARATSEASALVGALWPGAGRAAGDGGSVPAWWDEVSGPPVRVLVVDDNSINRHVARSMFHVLGASVALAETADEALARMGAERFDLVCLDVMLPGTDGLELTRQIRRRFGHGPLVVGVSAMATARDRCLDAGMDAFFAKPLRLGQAASAMALGRAATAIALDRAANAGP